MSHFTMKETLLPLQRHAEADEDAREELLCLISARQDCLASLPGYGTLPLVTSSVSSIPKDHTSDLMLKRPYKAASGAVHLIGNLAPEGEKNRRGKVKQEQQESF